MARITLLLATAIATFASVANAQFLFRKSARVLTDAWASPAFSERRETANGPARLTYHFYEGNFHGGAINDKSVRRVSLQEIAETLAEDMATQNFHPAETVAEGDMVIIVHWGVTVVEAKWDELFPESDQGSETEVEEDGFETVLPGAAPDLSTTGRPSVAKNAQITGIQKALQKEGLSQSEREEVRSLLEEERYFIALMAYDWQLMQKEKKRELLWTLRFSLPATGTNFVDAVPSLSRAATPYIGTNLEDLAKTKTQLGWGKGAMGELEVIESISEEELSDTEK